MHTRRQWMTGWAAGALFPQPQPRRPNVILILTDDQGYGDMSCHGNPHLATPNIDRLAREGVEFTRFYVSPVCAPTRSSLLTGRYNLRTAVHGVTGGRETLRADETTLAEALRGAGYRTALFGKWHLGEHYPYVPHAQGFDEYTGFRTGHWNLYFDSPVERNGKPAQLRGYITDALTDEALRFVEGNRNRPFFLYLAYNAPHAPYQLPQQTYERYKAKGLPDQVAAVYGMVEHIDRNIGRLLRRLDELELARDTLVLFLTDNGPNGARYNAGLRGAKGAVYEGGIRTACFLRWPARLEAGRRISRMAAHIDVYPTLLELCDVRRPPGKPIDGVSLAPLLQARHLAQAEAAWPDRRFFTHRAPDRDPAAMYPGAVRTQQYSLVNGRELYDLEKDPGEQTDIAGQRPAVVAALRAEYEAWFRKAADECGFARLPIPVGYDEENPVTLTAPQCYFNGKLRYHRGPGFAHDWVVNWVDPADSVWWEIDVARPGRYEVALDYLCPEGQTGAELRVRCGSAAVQARVQRATSMRQRPVYDPVSLSEYQEMDWASLPMGTLELAAGRARIRVEVVSKPAPLAVELKGLRLRRLG